MICPLSYRQSRAAQTKGAFALSEGILGIGAPLWQRAASVTQTRVTVHTWAMLLEDVMRVVNLSRMTRLTGKRKKKETRRECLFYSITWTTLFTTNNSVQEQFTEAFTSEVEGKKFLAAKGGQLLWKNKAAASDRICFSGRWLQVWANMLLTTAKRREAWFQARCQE